jgi:hypothetical protein
MSTSNKPPKNILINQLHKRNAIFEIISAKYIDKSADFESVPCLIANGGLRLDLYSQVGNSLAHIRRFELGFVCSKISYLNFIKEIPGNRKSKFENN